MNPWRRSLAVAAVLTWAVAAPRAQAQMGWDATLHVDPYPSPYLSDWQTNPT